MPDTNQNPTEAVTSLMQQHGGKLYRMGLRICGSHDDAEDLVQETFLNAYKAWDQFRGDADPATWLYTIATRVCQRQKRLRSGQPRHMTSLSTPNVDTEDFVLDLPDPGSDPYEDQVQRETQQIVENAISELPMNFRMPLVLKEIAGLPLSAIAEILEIKEATIKTRVHRARLMLRQILTTRLPKKPVDDPRETVCASLIQAKQDAMDRGVDFPVDPALLNEKCCSLFATLDLGQQVCAEIARGELPDEVKERVMTSFDSGS